MLIELGDGFSLARFFWWGVKRVHLKGLGDVGFMWEGVGGWCLS
jgi:hypothetical protein